MPYNPALVAPMSEEMVRLGAKELTTVTEVDAALGDPVLPQQVVTVFAGQDLEATSRARQYFAEYQPSSPSMALLRDGEVVHFVHRHQIEGRSPQAIAGELVKAFDKHFGAAV